MCLPAVHVLQDDEIDNGFRIAYTLDVVQKPEVAHIHNQYASL
jgi:hypothetical protein